MSIEVIVGDHQSKVRLPEEWLWLLESGGTLAAAEVAARHRIDGAPLGSLACVEVALVDDETSERVHREFMGIEGATDVITFEHGEIVIGIEVARRQAEEFGEPELRELFRYIVHGLLHLAGHEDEQEADRAVMEAAQEAVVTRLWPEIAG